MEEMMSHCRGYVTLSSLRWGARAAQRLGVSLQGILTNQHRDSLSGHSETAKTEAVTWKSWRSPTKNSIISFLKMTEVRPEVAKQLPSARSDKFSVVTTAGNEAVKVMTKSLDQDATAIVDTIRKVMPEVLQTVVEVTFEKAKLWSVIDKNPDLAYYTNLDYDSWMNPGEDLNKSDMKQATVSF